MAGVTAAVRYDGAPVLRVNGVFLAGMAVHASAEPDSLVLPAGAESRAAMLAEAPEVYYLTPYYARHPVVLVRLRQVPPDVLRELLTLAWRRVRRRPSP